MSKYPTSDTRFRFRTHNIFRNIISKHASSKSIILDIGCASGVIANLAPKNYKVIGIENNPIYFSSAKKHCSKLYTFDLNDFSQYQQLSEKKFDLIFFGDVLEHLLNPQKVLTFFKNRLNKNGYIIISLPNIAQLPFRLSHLFGTFNYQDKGVMDSTHLHLYTLATSRQLINSCNLKIIQVYPSGTIYSFFPFFPTLICPQFVFLCQKQ